MTDALAARHIDRDVQKLRTILVVDNEEDILSMMADAFKRVGLDAVSATSVDDALAIVSNVSLLAVLSDIDMDGPSGLELLDHLRVNAPSLPVYLMSGGSIQPEKILERGGRGFFQKPFSPNDIAAQIFTECRAT